MNPGKIKWNVNITATINTKNSSEEDIEELNHLIKSVNEFNCEAIFYPKKILQKKLRGRKRRTKGMNIFTNSKETKLSFNFDTDSPSPYVFNDSFEGIKNVKKWFELITNDRDWDHRFIIEALRFKIKNTADYIQLKQRHLNWEQDVKYMKIVCKLIDKLWGDYTSEEENYDSEYSKYHESINTWKPVGETGIEEKAKNIVTAANRDGQIGEILDDEEYNPLDIEKIEEELTKEYLKTYSGNLLMGTKEISECFDDYFAANKLMHKKTINYLKNNTTWMQPNSKQTQAMVLSKLKHEKAKKLLFKILSDKIESWWD